MRPHNRIQSAAVDPIEQIALRYLARRDRSEAHLRAYLGKSGASPSRIRTVLARLRAVGYVDDQAFAQRWARDRMARKPMGRLRLEAELEAQGVDEHIIFNTVEEIYTATDERIVAVQLLKARPVTPAFLRRRGFSEDTIESVLRTE